jgi:hypothetical protein
MHEGAVGDDEHREYSMWIAIGLGTRMVRSLSPMSFLRRASLQRFAAPSTSSPSSKGFLRAFRRRSDAH